MSHGPWIIVIEHFRTDKANSPFLYRKDDRGKRRDSPRSSERMIVFETSEPSKSATKGQTLSNSKSSKRGGSLFRKPSDMSSDEDTEELPRSDENHTGEQDMIIFIQMALHPMTLEDYLWPDQQSDQSKPIRHCFHPSTTARITLGKIIGESFLFQADFGMFCIPRMSHGLLRH